MLRASELLIEWIREMDDWNKNLTGEHSLNFNNSAIPYFGFEREDMCFRLLSQFFLIQIFLQRNEHQDISAPQIFKTIAKDAQSQRREGRP